MSTIKFGPSGLGSVKNAVSRLEELHDLGLSACEVAFVRQVYIKKDDALVISKRAKELGIFLSVHAQYYVNLNSKEPEKIEAADSKLIDKMLAGETLTPGECRTLKLIWDYRGKQEKRAASHDTSIPLEGAPSPQEKDEIFDWALLKGAVKLDKLI